MIRRRCERRRRPARSRRSRRRSRSRSGATPNRPRHSPERAPDRTLELVARPVLNFWARRGLEPQPTPIFANAGPKVAAINGQAGSGGDAFPYSFRKAGLGPLIGTRTWGGLIGLSGNPLLDGGTITAPTFRFLGTDGTWQVEGVGVAPDIEVIDWPDLVAKGLDPTLDKGIEVLMQQLAKAPPKPIVVPPAPR